MKSIILKSVAWTMICISQLSASLIFLQIFIRIQKKWCETQNLEIKFHFDVFWYCYPTRLWHFDEVYNLTLSYCWKDYSNGPGSYFAIFETEYSFQFVSANPPFLSSPTPDSNSYYLVVAIAKIPQICKRKPLNVYFSICKSQDCATNRQWIIWSKLIDCQSDTFF